MEEKATRFGRFLLILDEWMTIKSLSTVDKVLCTCKLVERHSLELYGNRDKMKAQ